MECLCSPLIVFALLLFLKVSSIECQVSVYSLTTTNRVPNNTLTLQCKDESGNPVPNAVFYRNGVLNTSDECFDSSVSIATNKLRFTISPECEGYYMCGARNGNGVVLSEPIPIYGEFVSNLPSPRNIYIYIYITLILLVTAYPEHTSNYNGTKQSLSVVAGTSITLPCHVRVSALGRYTVNWITRNSRNQRRKITKSHNSDYSLTLTNLDALKDSCK